MRHIVLISTHYFKISSRYSKRLPSDGPQEKIYDGQTKRNINIFFFFFFFSFFFFFFFCQDGRIKIERSFNNVFVYS